MRPLTAARLPFVVLVGSILAVGLVVLLLLHTMAAQDAFRLEALQHESAQLADTRQQLALAQQEQEAPSSLATRARALGMVPTGSIAYVDLDRHGKIVGVVQAAPSPAPPAPSLSPSPSPSPSTSAKPAAGTSTKAAAGMPGASPGPGPSTRAHTSSAHHRTDTRRRSGARSRRVSRATRR